MNSVALPASATAGALGAEDDLIRQAARGDEESFGELYRRHSQTAWRLAQAVAVDRDGAIGAVAEGFGRSLRNLRRQSRLDPEAYRPLLLAAVYKAAVDHVHSHSMPTPTFAARSVPKGKGAHAKGANTALLEAAFRSLPERWRAAVWLGDAESMEPERIAAALGVSSAVASQLLTRGRRGLAGRFVQARRPEPEHLGSALRPLAAAVPANLADETAARWKALVTDAGARFAPLTGWMNERAVRPLWVSVGALMGLGLIGLGIVGQSSTVNNGGVATSRLPGASAAGVNPFPTTGGPGGLIGGVGTVAPNGGLNPFFATGGGGGGSGSTFFGNTPLGPVAPGSGNGNTPSGPTGSPGPTGGPTTGTPPPTQGNTVLNSPVLSVTNSGGLGGTTNLNVTGQTGTLGTVTVTPSPTGCTGATIAGKPIGCTTTAPAPAPAGTPTVNPGAVTPTGGASTTNPLSTTTQTVTNTLGAATSGL